MTDAVHSPQDTKPGQVVNLSGRKLWRKQVLPLTEINYDGRRIRFDRAYHEELVRNFRAGAYPQVPFQLADADNRHTNDPERTRGELVDLRAESDGLYAYVNLTNPGAVLNNPKLGVSCRILEGYTRESDGKYFGRALQHVLGTLDPRIVDMKPWECVELSGKQAERTVDLSGQFYTKDGDEMSGTTTGEDKHVVELSTAQLERLNAFLADDPDDEEEGEGEVDTNDQFDFSDFADGEEDEGQEFEYDQDEENREQVALAAVHNLEGRVLELTNQLATRDAEFELEQLAATGLAPAIIEAARPLLQIPQGVVELSNGEVTSPARQVRTLLRTVLELSNRGMDLVSFEETGSGGGRDSAAAERDAINDAMDKQFGN